ncbi:MAG: GspE/PulE family protein [Patescibacteria group bacterium]
MVATNSALGTNPLATAGAVSDDDIHGHDGAPERALGETKVPYDVLKYIPETSAVHYQFAPLGVVDGVLEVGMVDPENLAAIDALSFIARKTGTPFKIFKITADDFEKIKVMYRGIGGDVDKALSDLESENLAQSKQPKVDSHDEVEEKVDLSGGLAAVSGKGGGGDLREDAPAIKLVSTILRYAIDGKASDIHIEPTASGVRIRYRVDGSLHTSVVLPIETHRALVARIKVLSSIRLDERRKPQDGRFSASIDGRQVDFRVSTFPSYNGEKIVIRILDREQGFIPLSDLGFTDRALASIRSALKRPYGLILISGPTGSGKSTTLYSMLAEVDRETQNVLSLEDPVEYYMEGVIQSQIRPEIGYTFANGLRTTLRQDPNVIMVGEIRDGETAKLAVQAALTGHLVLATIHTNSAIGTIPRLIDMGVESYLIPPTLVLSMAQRLTRKLCPDSGEPIPVSESMRSMMDAQMSTLAPEYRIPIPDSVFEARRTPSCPNGTRGRLAVFEVMEMTAEVEKIILKSPVESRIWAAARKQGMMSMKEDAMIKAFAGKIPFAEVSALSGILLSEEDEFKADVVVPTAETVKSVVAPVLQADANDTLESDSLTADKM